MSNDKLIEAIENLRRDKHQPGRYILFTFLNGIAQGLGLALGTTLVLGLLIYFLVQVLTSLVDFPLVGKYFNEVVKLIEAYSKQMPRVR